jgi:hypothetical protein
MKKQFFLTVILAIGLIAVSSASAVSYSTDFSSDPGWITDQPGNYYWENGTLKVRAENHSPGYTPSRYCYHLLPQVVDSFDLSWDVKPTRLDWSAGVMFGLYDNTLKTGGTGQIGQSQYIQACPGLVDGGLYWGIYALGATGYNEASFYVSVNYNTWYTCQISYVDATKTAVFSVRERGSVNPIWSTSLQIPGGFSQLQYLGTSRGGIGDNGSYPGLSSTAIAEGYIDNVVLSAATEPTPKISAPKLTLNSIGSTMAWLTWYPGINSDGITYKVYVWNRASSSQSWGEPTIIDKDNEGNLIAVPWAIISDLDVSSKHQYKFAVTSVDSQGNESDQSNTGEGATTKPKNKAKPPTNPIVLVPGVGSTLVKDDSFTVVRTEFKELGWECAVGATPTYPAINLGNGKTLHLYGDIYVPDSTPKWYQNKEPSDYSKISVFTFVPFMPDWKWDDGSDAHEIGIAQKGIELGNFLKYLEGKGKNNFQLVGHSLGGLTCRAYLQRVVTPYAYQNDVSSLITTGTPHDGVMKDHDQYSQIGVKDILLDGYFNDSWRKTAWADHGFTDDQDIKTELYIIIDYLGWSGWDFEGQTLQQDVLHNSPTFLNYLNLGQAGGSYGKLPKLTNTYISLVGEVKIFAPKFTSKSTAPAWGGLNSYLGYGDGADHQYSGQSEASIVRGGDGFISTYSQNLGNVTDRTVKAIPRTFNHYDEEGDCIGILMGLGYPVLSIQAKCPVDLIVTAPSGQYIAKNDIAMFLATYREIEDDNSPTPHKLIEIPFPEEGTYSIEVIPDSDADPNATYSLVVTRGDTVTVLADNVKISDIPQEPYQVSGDTAPVANAGPDQTVYAWIDGIAEVKLDGSGSYDDDNDTLTYKWTWAIDGITYDANGVKPSIELPVGQHIITLIVNDGLIDSEPNEVNITVIGAVEGNLNITPEVLNCRSHQPKIKAKLCLPKGITKDQIDTSKPILLYPGEIEADKIWISQDKDKCRVLRTVINASFDKDELIDAIPNNGQVELVVVGQLKTGQYFFGTDEIRIINPGNWHWHYNPWWNFRWNRWCQRPFNCGH